MLKKSIAVVIAVLLLGSVHAQCTDYIEKFRTLEVGEELKPIRQEVLLLLYSQGECLEHRREFLNKTLEFIEKYTLAEREYSSSNASGALEIGMEIKGIASTLNPENALEEEIAGYIRDASKTLLERIAQEEEIKAEASPVTREKLRSYDIAIKAYRASDNAIEASALSVRRSIVRDRYIRDMKIAEHYESIARDNLKKAQAQSSFIDAYVLAREADINFRKALEIYEKHSEEGKKALVQQGMSLAEEILKETRRKILLFYGLATVVLVALSLYSLYVSTSWLRDTYECCLGNELVKGEEVEA